MIWFIIDSIISPQTCTACSCLCTAKSFKAILWYHADTFLYPGDKIEIENNGVLVNNTSKKIMIYDFIPFNIKTWQTLSKYTGCPCNGAILPVSCNYPYPCKLLKCPYNLKQSAINFFKS